MTIVTMTHEKYGIVKQLYLKGKVCKDKVMKELRNCYGLKIYECVIKFEVKKAKPLGYRKRNDYRKVLDMATGEVYKDCRTAKEALPHIHPATIYTHLYRRLKIESKYRFKWAN